MLRNSMGHSGVILDRRRCGRRDSLTIAINVENRPNRSPKLGISARRSGKISGQRVKYFDQYRGPIQRSDCKH
jgi:hypothetical protein